MRTANIVVLVLLGAGLTLPGCGNGYVLTGRVVEGAGLIMEIAPDQAAAAGQAVPGAGITLYRDPDRNMLKLATGSSDAQGNFRIPVQAFGAGWMDEEWLIEVVCRGYDTLEVLRPLPDEKSNRWLLISLAPGRSTTPERSQGLWEEFERRK